MTSAWQGALPSGIRSLPISEVSKYTYDRNAKPFNVSLAHRFFIFPPHLSIFYTRRAANSQQITNPFFLLHALLSNEASCFDHSFILFGGYA